MFNNSNIIYMPGGGRTEPARTISAKESNCLAAAFARTRTLLWARIRSRTAASFSASGRPTPRASASPAVLTAGTRTATRSPLAAAACGKAPFAAYGRSTCINTPSPLARASRYSKATLTLSMPKRRRRRPRRSTTSTATAGATTPGCGRGKNAVSTAAPYASTNCMRVPGGATGRTPPSPTRCWPTN